MIDGASEKGLQRALQASAGSRAVVASRPAVSSSSKYDPNAIADCCREVLNNTRDILEKDRASLFRQPNIHTLETVNFQQSLPSILQRPVESQDLAYSKAKNNQLWVPFLEKAYAKSHGTCLFSFVIWILKDIASYRVAHLFLSFSLSLS